MPNRLFTPSDPRRRSSRRGASRARGNKSEITVDLRRQIAIIRPWLPLLVVAVLLAGGSRVRPEQPAAEDLRGQGDTDRRPIPPGGKPGHQPAPGFAARCRRRTRRSRRSGPSWTRPSRSSASGAPRRPGKARQGRRAARQHAPDDLCPGRRPARPPPSRTRLPSSSSRPRPRSRAARPNPGVHRCRHQGRRRTRSRRRRPRSRP